MMKMTIKAVMRWEQLRDKPFGRIDYADEADVEAMLYVLYGLEHGVTLDVFRRTLKNRKTYARMVGDFTREIKLMSQFTKKSDGGKKQEEPEREVERIGDIAAGLVMEGMSAEWVMEKMSMYDLPVFLEAANRKRKEAMEEERFWTYVKLLPHVDKNALKDGPRSLVEFAWEHEEKMEITDREVEMFEKFMEKGKTMFK